jgi:hypothetical protein
MIVKVLQKLSAAGVVDCLMNYLSSSFFDFKRFHNAASTEVDPVLIDDLDLFCEEVFFINEK